MSGAHHHRAAAWELYFTTTARLTERIEAALKCQSGLSMPEYSVLLMTDRAGEAGIRPSVLAHKVVFSRSRLTHTMKRLESRNLISRRPCQGDGRGGLVFLTDAGKRLFDEAAIVQRDVIRRLFLNEITPEEIDMLTGLFSRVSERINNDTPCP
ncbi:MarR family transcriptional regulator [Actinomyces sp. ICM47]|uniref:MarR family winged helix-turn-helix transcriptional regulator n=1 Tax=Actinomycetaceae TaxID=2049 RepID=UPI00027337BD|nr:MarR family transcriptional regulator [Actinomyces sp. ICM47]EJG15479.1 MarR family protein [Actinomyces sp. ICM47]MBF0969243.1 MarR family transcriptional regulator [Actinomyces sp.]